MTKKVHEEIEIKETIGEPKKKIEKGTTVDPNRFKTRKVIRKVEE